MKLDKIKLAMLIGFVSCRYAITLTQYDIAEIDQIIDFELPAPAEPPVFNAENLHTLMALMCEGTNRIEAIRQHRMMTGYGVKESKDIIEKYWREKNTSHERAL